MIGKLNKFFVFQTVGLSVDEVAKVLLLPQPNCMKIDFDGIEHLTLSGAKNIFSGIDNLLIEVNDDFLSKLISIKNSFLWLV
jgi:hypothetical protein